ncbi:MAG: ankyrin repeat domain-containing protein [Armatimonadota bacterium]
MHLNKILILSSIALAALTSDVVLAGNSHDGGKTLVLSNTAIALPEGCKVKVRWVSPPLDSSVASKASLHNLDFAVDSAGTPWIGYQRKYMISPVKQCRFSLPTLYTSFSCTNNGALLMTTKSDLCFVVPPKKLSLSKDNIPEAGYQPIANLPTYYSKVFGGLDGSIFLVAPRGDGGSDIFKYTPCKSVVRGYEKIFTSDYGARAVSGDANNVFVAVEGAILKISVPDGSITKLYADPDEVVESLAYYPGTGLFYSTGSSIGYIGANGPMPFITAPDTLISLRNGTLYILFKNSLGIIALDDIGDIKRFARAIKKVPFHTTKDVKLTGMRFFEGGEEVSAGSDKRYASVFDRRTTRYIYCEFGVVNLRQNQNVRNKNLTMKLYEAGSNKPISIGRQDITFKPDSPSVTVWRKYGSRYPDTIYPLKYVMRIYSNDTLLGESSFTVTGTPTIEEAVEHGNIQAAANLIKSGADLNTVSVFGSTLLITAVKASNIEMVKLLLDSGSDVNAQDKDGRTALYNAAIRLNLPAVKILLEYGAKTEIKDESGLTALAVAYLGICHADIINSLLSHGADPNAECADGNAAIFNAIDGYNADVVSELVKHGANVNSSCKEHNGTQRSVLGYTLHKYYLVQGDRKYRNNLQKIAVILQENGANLNTAEFTDAYFEGIDQLLDENHMCRLLEMSETAAGHYETNNPYLQKACLRGLLNAARRRISDENYIAAENLCNEAILFAIKFGLVSSFPEVYFDAGLVAEYSGNSGYAHKYLKEYLKIAPAGSCASQAREIMSGLK